MESRVRRMNIASLIDVSLTLSALVAIGVGVGMHDMGAALVVVGAVVLAVVFMSRVKLKGPKQ
jgi:hypothetical protein